MEDNYIIAWVKSENPYMSIRQEGEAHDEEYHDGVLPPENDTGHFDLSGERDDLLEEKPGMRALNAILTPVGAVILNEYTDTYSLFNFWTGHTNFGITKGIARMISETPGVEVLHIFTRYRMRIAVGKCFKARDVCSAISERLKQYLQNPPKQEEDPPKLEEKPPVQEEKQVEQEEMAAPNEQPE